MVIGNILDKKTNKGFPGMHIYFKPTRKVYGEVSNINGYFEIEVINDYKELFFAFVGQRKIVLDLDDYRISRSDERTN